MVFIVYFFDSTACLYFSAEVMQTTSSKLAQPGVAALFATTSRYLLRSFDKMLPLRFFTLKHIQRPAFGATKLIPI